MKNQNGFVPVILILIVLFGFIGVYYLGTLKSKNPTVSPTLTPVASALPSPIATSKSATPDPTVNWKTYVNSEGKYQVKYPSDYVLDDMVEDEYQTNSVAADASQIYITRQKDDWENRIVTIQVGGNLLDEITVAKLTDVNINNINAKTGVFNGKKLYLIMLDNNEILIDTQQDNNVALKILSTFKFTN